MLTPKQIDAVTKIINIGVGKGSASLGRIVDGEISLRVRGINVVAFDAVINELDRHKMSYIHSQVDPEKFSHVLICKLTLALREKMRKEKY